MNFADIIKQSLWRSRKPEYWCGWRYELKYDLRQARALVLLRLHVLAESAARHPTPKKDEHGTPEHAECCYPDPPDHMVVTCLCGKEWS